MQILKYIIVLLAAAVSAATDIKEYKIKNIITVPTAVLGLVLAPADRAVTLGGSLLGLLLPFIICLFFYMAGMLKAGDVKLFMCIGAVMGPKWIINCMAASVLAGGITAVLISIKRRCLKKRFIKLFDYIKNIFYSRTFVYYGAAGDPEGRFPFGVCIFMGTAAAVITDLTGLHIFF